MRVNVRVVNSGITDVRSDVIIVNLFQDIAGPAGATGAVDRATGGAVSLAVQSGEFDGKLGDTLVLRCSGVGIPKAIVVGLGPAAQFTAEKARRAAGSAMRQASKMKARTVATIVHGAGIGGLDPEMCARATVEGSLLGAHNYAGFKAKAAELGPSELLVAEIDASRIGSIERGARTGAVIAEAVNLARDLVNAPANKMTPSMMAEVAQKVAQEAGLECRVLERQDMADLGMGRCWVWPRAPRSRPR